MKMQLAIKSIPLWILLMSFQGCAVLTQSQVNAVGDFAIAAENFSELPIAVIDNHVQTMSAENIYASASLSDIDSTSYKINKDVDLYLQSLNTSAQAQIALNVVLASYVQLLKNLTSSSFNKKFEQQCAVLGTEIDGGVYQYNELTGEEMDGFGVIVAETVRASGGVFMRNKQAEAVKQAINGAQPVIMNMSGSITELLDLYICGAVDQIGRCVLDDNNQPFPGLAQLVEEDLVKEYQDFLRSGKGQNSVKNIQIFSQLLLKAKSIKPLAEKTRRAMLTFRLAHTRLFENLQDNQTLEGTKGEINILYGEIQSALRFKEMVENQN